MSTRRERLERKLEKRAQWAESAKARAAARFDAADELAHMRPLGQPILVGHHSERMARRHQARIETNMEKGCEASSLARHHEQKAAGLEAQLERCVFSDDADAIEQIEARIAANETKADRYAEINKAWRRGGQAALARIVSEGLAVKFAKTMAECPWLRVPMDTTNLRARIRSDKERSADIKRRQERAAKAEAAGGVLIEGDEYVRVTFAEKPEREILEALKAAGFRWGGGYWCGERKALPPQLVEWSLPIADGRQ